jgi:hypothetical protein
MFVWSRNKPQPAEVATGIVARVNQLETRLERLELDHAERQVAVLNTLEKVLHQLAAREGKRVRDRAADPTEEALEGVADVARVAPGPRAARVDTSHLSRRFRVGGG